MGLNRGRGTKLQSVILVLWKLATKVFRHRRLNTCARFLANIPGCFRETDSGAEVSHFDFFFAKLSERKNISTSSAVFYERTAKTWPWQRLLEQAGRWMKILPFCQRSPPRSAAASYVRVLLRHLSLPSLLLLPGRTKHHAIRLFGCKVM